MTLTHDYVQQVFALLEQGQIDRYLAEYVAEDVQWTITGSNVLADTYTSRDDFVNRAIARLKASLAGSIRWEVHHVYVDGDTAIVEMTSIATAKKGHPYRNEYVWIQRFEAGKIVEARVYYDDVLVDKTML